MKKLNELTMKEVQELSVKDYLKLKRETPKTDDTLIDNILRPLPLDFIMEIEVLRSRTVLACAEIKAQIIIKEQREDIAVLISVLETVLGRGRK